MAPRTTSRQTAVEVPDVSARLAAVSAHLEKSVSGVKAMRLDGPIEQVPVIPTGSIALDDALGVGGYPCGRIIEVYGEFSSGKTTLTLHAIASAQRTGGIAVFIDAEHSLDPRYARALGVNMESLLIVQPDCGEQALEAADKLLDENNFKQGDIIVIDSVAALTPRAELEGEMGDQHMGLQARLMSQALRKLTGRCARSGAVIFFTNQTRQKIGPFAGTTTAGGNALKFYASVRINACKKSVIKAKLGDRDEVPVAVETEFTVVKNKVAPPYRTGYTTIRYGEGVSKTDEIVDYGIDLGIIEQRGSWYSYGAERLDQGKDNVRNLLRSQTKMAAEIEAKIKDKLRERRASLRCG